VGTIGQAVDGPAARHVDLATVEMDRPCCRRRRENRKRRGNRNPCTKDAHIRVNHRTQQSIRPTPHPNCIKFPTCQSGNLMQFG
jgi:hypothetical protein